MAGFVSEIESLNQRESKGERHSRKDDDRRVWEGREWDRIVRDFFLVLSQGDFSNFLGDENSFLMQV
jgi:hypothetical protein